ncbi:uncharacterized protein [Argopecten irradians]|uniref:uncharacterized protein n=1 Tax=Argopecten irradians TaxID=31199 RepID=UPI003712724F
MLIKSGKIYFIVNFIGWMDICSHIVGLLKTLQGLKLHNYTSVPQHQSCTSVPQQWNVPRGPKIKPVPINHVVVARPLESRKRKPIICHLDENYPIPNVTEDELKNLADIAGSPLQYILSSSRSNIPSTSTPFGNVPIGSSLSYQTRNLKAAPAPTVSFGCGDTSVHRQSPVVLPEVFRFLNRHMEQANIEYIEKTTRSQALSDTWLNERKVRLTTSNFGRVISRKAKPTPSFLEDVFNRTTKSAPALDYGSKHEKEAKAKYLETFPSRHIHDCGFIINNNFNFLGASPDGKVCDNGECGILEVKCPYSARNMDIDRACDEIDGFCLERNGQAMSLKKNHMYFAQVQGQLMISGCNFCEFVVFTQRSLFVERIFPDVPYMENMLVKLSTFMKEHGQQYMV